MPLHAVAAEATTVVVKLESSGKRWATIGNGIPDLTMRSTWASFAHVTIETKSLR